MTRLHKTGIPGLLSTTRLDRLSREDLGYAAIVHESDTRWLAGDPSAMITDDPFTTPLTRTEVEWFALDIGRIIAEDA